MAICTICTIITDEPRRLFDAPVCAYCLDAYPAATPARQAFMRLAAQEYLRRQAGAAARPAPARLPRAARGSIGGFSIRQPYATLIVCGLLTTYDYRSCVTERGLVVIRAAVEQGVGLRWYAANHPEIAPQLAAYGLTLASALPRAALVGAARLVGCAPNDDDGGHRLTFAAPTRFATAIPWPHSGTGKRGVWPLCQQQVVEP